MDNITLEEVVTTTLRIASENLTQTFGQNNFDHRQEQLKILSLKNRIVQEIQLQNAYNTSKVSRVEVIDHSSELKGRVYTNQNAKDVELQFQDDNRTLKIFLK